MMICGSLFHPHPNAGAGGHLHPVLDPRLETPHHHWADGCVHRLIYMETGLVP